MDVMGIHSVLKTRFLYHAFMYAPLCLFFSFEELMGCMLVNLSYQDSILSLYGDSMYTSLHENDLQATDVNGEKRFHLFFIDALFRGLSLATILYPL